jgi:hypothetical protein
VPVAEMEESMGDTTAQPQARVGNTLPARYAKLVFTYITYLSLLSLSCHCCHLSVDLQAQNAIFVFGLFVCYFVLVGQ